MADISNRQELLALLGKQGKAPKRTHEQNVFAMMAIVRKMVHPEARLHKAVDGTYTITIPPKETS